MISMGPGVRSRSFDFKKTPSRKRKSCENKNIANEWPVPEATNNENNYKAQSVNFFSPIIAHLSTTEHLNWSGRSDGWKAFLTASGPTVSFINNSITTSVDSIYCTTKPLNGVKLHFFFAAVCFLWENRFDGKIIDLISLTFIIAKYLIYFFFFFGNFHTRFSYQINFTGFSFFYLISLISLFLNWRLSSSWLSNKATCKTSALSLDKTHWHMCFTNYYIIHARQTSKTSPIRLICFKHLINWRLEIDWFHVHRNLFKNLRKIYS